MGGASGARRTATCVLLAVLGLGLATGARAASPAGPPLPTGAASDSSQAAALLASDPIAAMIQAEAQVNYDGLLAFDHGAEARVTHATGDRRRFEYVAPTDMKGELVIYNGRIRWHYSPRTHRVDLAPSDTALEALRTRERLIRSNYRVGVGAKAVLAGRPVEEVDLTPRHRDGNAERLWLDLETGLPLKVVRADARGLELEHSEFRQFTVLRAAPERKFDLSLPDAARVAPSVVRVANGHTLAEVARFVRFPVRLPSYLPEGYEVLDIRVFEEKHVRTLHWRLTDGVDTLSLFVTAARHHASAPREARRVPLGAGVEGFAVSHAQSQLLSWSTRQTSYTLIGQLPGSELEQIARSSLR